MTTDQTISRRTLVSGSLAAGLTACTMGIARTAFADDTKAEVTDVVPEPAERTTLHGLEGSMYDPDRDITDEEVLLLLQAALTAPSAVGAKSLELVVIRDRETMQKIHEFSPNANELESCPVCIALVEHDTEDAHPRFYQYDTGLAAMALLVQASAMGISSCVCEARAQDKDTQRTTTTRSSAVTWRPIIPSSSSPWATLPSTPRRAPRWTITPNPASTSRRSTHKRASTEH